MNPANIVMSEREGLFALWFQLEERSKRLFRVLRDDKSFLTRPALFFLSFCFRHIVYVSQICRVPVLGFEPRRPNWTLGCKPSLNASSSTRGQLQNVGVGKVRKNFPAPAFFGTLLFHSLKPVNLTAMQFLATRRRYLFDFFHALHGAVNGKKHVALCFRFNSIALQFTSERRGGHPFGMLAKYDSNSFGDTDFSRDQRRCRDSLLSCCFVVTVPNASPRFNIGINILNLLGEFLFTALKVEKFFVRCVEFVFVCHVT
jgi:hypothetical protein